MSLNYDNLDWADGAVNIPGIRPVVFFIRKTDILVWPTFAAAPANDDEEVTYVGDFGLAVGKTFKRMSLLDEKSPVIFEPQGEQSSRSFLNKATLKVPLSKKKATAFAKKANNDDLVYLIQEKMGEFRVVGNEMFRTNTSVTQALGGAPTEERATTLEVSVTDAMPAPYYTGSIVTDDGDINPPPAG